MTPHELAAKKLEYTARYERASEELEKIKLMKADKWMEIRKGSKTNAETDMLWNASEEGKKELSLSMEMKRIEKSLSAFNTILRVKENEARGW